MENEKGKGAELDSSDIVRWLCGAACFSAVAFVVCALSCVGGGDGVLSGIREGVAFGAKSVPFAFGGFLVVVGCFIEFVPWRGFRWRGLALPLIGLLVIGVSALGGVYDSVLMNECYILGYRDGERGRPMVDVRDSEKVYPRVMDALLKRQRENGRGAE